MVHMRFFRRRQIAQQFARGGIRGARRRAAVKRRRLLLHPRRFGADRIQPQGFVQPDRFAGVKPGHMFAPDQGDHLAEAALVQVDQALAVPVLFGRHAVKHRRRGRIIPPQPLRIGPVNPRVVLLGRDGEGKDFLFGQVRKAATRGDAGDHGGLIDWNGSNLGGKGGNEKAWAGEGSSGRRASPLCPI